MHTGTGPACNHQFTSQHHLFHQYVTLHLNREFVRPSYGKVNTWGTVTTTYGGVGYAANYVEESGKGSVSRSHRHFGTGCVNL